MKGALRLAMTIWTVGLLLAPPAAFAQEAPPTSNTPAADSVGPRELQNFSLSGNVIRPAEQPVEQPTPRTRSVARSEPTPPAAREPTRKVAEKTAATTPPPSRPSSATVIQVKSDVERPVLPSPAAPATAVAASAPAASFAPAPESPTGTLAPEHRLLIWPWILAAIVLVAAGALLFWRNRSHRLAVAGGPQLDLFAAPEPAPAPAPPPPPPAPRVPEPAPPRALGGVVSTSLRPWLEVSVQPLRCIITARDVTIEFELDVLNSGNAPARQVHIAAAVINAGPTQDEELRSFFAQDPGPANRIEVIQPQKRVTFTTQMTIALDQIRPLEIGGRPVFVPIIAFNANYGWSSKNGQTSVSYLLGRDTKAERLSPFRFDLGPRVFRGLGGRLLPTGVRR